MADFKSYNHTHFSRRPRSRRVRRWHDVVQRPGTATVEFAVCVPVIFMMFLGAIELTRLNFIRHTASNACYEAARKAIVPGSSNSDAINEATRLLDSMGISNGVSTQIATTADRVTVTITVPARLNSWGISRYSGGSNCVQSCTLARETLR